jgi:hypothetical protein
MESWKDDYLKLSTSSWTLKAGSYFIEITIRVRKRGFNKHESSSKSAQAEIKDILNLSVGATSYAKKFGPMI